jgi:hypothetical protein
MRLLFPAAGLAAVSIGFVFYFLARRDRKDGVSGSSFRPIWQLKDHYKSTGYLYLWVSALSFSIGGAIGIIAAVLEASRQ